MKSPLSKPPVIDSAHPSRFNPAALQRRAVTMGAPLVYRPSAVGQRTVAPGPPSIRPIAPVFAPNPLLHAPRINVGGPVAPALQRVAVQRQTIPQPRVAQRLVIQTRAATPRIIQMVGAPNGTRVEYKFTRSAIDDIQIIKVDLYRPGSNASIGQATLQQHAVPNMEGFNTAGSGIRGLSYALVYSLLTNVGGLTSTVNNVHGHLMQTLTGIGFVEVPLSRHVDPSSRGDAANYSCANVPAAVAGCLAAMGAARHNITLTQRSGGCCLVTTACVTSMGLPDDCYELRILRQFRDDYMRTRDHGDELVENYYELAPSVIAAIDARPDKAGIYREMFVLVQNCVALIEASELEQAMRTYANIVLELKARFLSDSSAEEKALEGILAETALHC
jgi:hypothetical protein